MIQTIEPSTEERQSHPTAAWRLTPTAVDDPQIAAERSSQLHASEGSATKKILNARNIFFLCLLIAASGIVSPSIALLGGVAYSMIIEHPLRREARDLAALLLQLSVVLLGFGMNLNEVIRTGRSGFLYTAISVTCAITLGLALGRLFKVRGKASCLIAVGTAICGGSAIAALAPILRADEEEISISMGTVFLLNSAALFIFPAVGWWLHLDQNQFGLWAALAIHDTSSVVGAAARYGNVALAVGTTVKLARALWIIPTSLATAFVISRAHGSKGTTSKAKTKFPWFIVFFVLASVVSTYLAGFGSLYGKINHLGKLGLTATLFLIGTGLSRKTLKQVGVGPLLQGVVLWLIVGVASLAAIYFHVITI